jgi:hypothetical protein
LVFAPGLNEQAEMDLDNTRQWAIKQYSIPFHLIKDLPYGAKSIMQAHHEAKIVYQTLSRAANLVAKRCALFVPERSGGRKKAANTEVATTTADSATPGPPAFFERWEFLLSEHENQGKRMVNGIIIMFTFYMPRADVHAIASARYLAAVQAATKRRGAAPPTEVPFSEDVSVARWDPLSEGLQLVFADNAMILKEIEMVKAKLKAAKRPGTEVANRPLVADTIPGNLTPYAYLNATTALSFHSVNITNFLQLDRYVTLDALHPAPGKVVDPRPFVTASLANLSADTIYRRPECPVNMANIFNHTTARHYYMNDVHHLQCIDRLQTNPVLYGLPARRGDRDVGDDDDDDDDDEMNAIDLLMQQALLPDQELGEEDREYRRIMNQPVGGGGGAAAAGDDANAAPVRLKPYQSALVRFTQACQPGDDLRPITSSPHPRLVYALDIRASKPGVIALVQFPFTIGDWITSEEIQSGGYRVDQEAIRLRFAATKILKQHEQQNPDLYKDIEKGLNAADHLRADNSELKAVADSIPQHELDQLLAEEQRTVLAALDRETVIAASGHHEILFKDASEPQSTHNAMHSDEFFEELPSSRERYSPTHILRLEARRLRLLHEKQSGVPHGPDLQQPGPVRAITDEVRKEIDQQVARVAQDKAIGDRNASRVAKEINTIPQLILDRDDLLQLRVKNQTAMISAKMAAQDRAKSLEKQGAKNDELLAVQKEHREKVYRARVAMIREVLQTLMASDNIANPLKSIDFRNFYNEHCNAQGLKAVFADRGGQDFDHKAFVLFYQELVDMLYTEAKASPQCTRPLLAKFFCSLDAHTWAFNRDKPALNMILVAATGIGKSYIDKQIERLTAPGIYKKVTNMTVNTFNTDTCYDNFILVFEEMKSSWLYMNQDTKEKGSSEELNFLKDRLTSFYTSVDSFMRDDKTGRRYVVNSTASHHNVTLGDTNQNLKHMDKNVERRFIIYFVPRYLLAVGIDPDENEEEYGKNSEGDAMYMRHRICNAMYITIRSCQKAAALPPMNRFGANQWFRPIKRELMLKGDKEASNKTKVHYIKQMAENIQLYFACWMGLFSPLAAVYHAQTDGSAHARWSPEAILDLIGPFMAVGKEALLLSLTLLDNLISPTYLKIMVRDIMLHGMLLDQPDKWQFRSLSVDRRGPASYDANYFAFSASKRDVLLGMIARFNSIFELREDEIDKLITDASTTYMRIQPYRASVLKEGTNEPMELEEDRSKAPIPLPIMGIEPSYAGPKGGATWTCYILVHYIENQFDVKFTNQQDIRANLRTKALAQGASANQPAVRSLWTDARIREHLKCRDGFTTITDVFRDVINTSVLERHELERRGSVLSPALFQYATGFLPDPISLRIPLPFGQTPLEVQVMLHGTPMFVHSSRSPQPKFHTFTNTIVRQATAERLRKRLREDPTGESQNARADAYNKSPAIANSVVDPDYVGAKQIMDELGNKPLAFLDELMGHGAVDAGSLLPIGFAPITYRILKNIAVLKHQHKEFLDYPAINVIDRLNAEMEAVDGKFTDIISLEGQTTIAGTTYGKVDTTEARRNQIIEERDRHAVDVAHCFVTPVHPSRGNGGNMRHLVGTTPFPYGGSFAPGSPVQRDEGDVDAMDIDLVVNNH